MCNQPVWDVQSPKTTRPTILLESQGPMLGCEAVPFEHHSQGRIKVMELKACERNTSLGAKPKSSDTKIDLIYKGAFWNYF